MEPKVITPPAIEPISIARARQFLRIDVPGYAGDTTQDQDIASWIRGARQWVEREIDKSIGEQTLMIAGESFYDLAMMPFGYGDPAARSIFLPRGPVTSIVSVDYITSDGFEASADPLSYRLTQLAPQRIVLKTGFGWPGASAEPESVRIIYKAGYVVPTIGTGVELYANNYANNYTSGPGSLLPYDLPDDLIAAMRLILGHLYRHRTASVDLVMQELPLGVHSLLWSSRASIGV